MFSLALGGLTRAYDPQFSPRSGAPRPSWRATFLRGRMVRIQISEGQGISKNGGCFLKRNPVLSAISASFGRVPFEIHGFILLYFVGGAIGVAGLSGKKHGLKSSHSNCGDRIDASFRKALFRFSARLGGLRARRAKKFCGESRFQQPLCSAHPGML
jgi:hypothetical protein